MTEPVNYDTTILKVSVHRRGDSPIYSDYATHIEIVDEGGGPFIALTSMAPPEGRVAIEVGEWPYVRAAVDSAIRGCQDIVKGMKRE